MISFWRPALLPFHSPSHYVTSPVNAPQLCSQCVPTAPGSESEQMSRTQLFGGATHALARYGGGGGGGESLQGMPGEHIKLTENSEFTLFHLPLNK
jgi:hypothetical protein